MIDVRQKILDENIRLHRVEAARYEKLHPEVFNWLEQHRIRKDLELITKMMPRPALALDIGCGTGNIFLKLISQEIDVWGVDISADMLKVLEFHIPDALHKNAHLIIKNIEDFLHECQMHFNLITMSSVLHHLPDYMAVLKSAICLLKPGGWLYITHEPTKNNLSTDPLLRKVLWQIDNIIYTISHPNIISKIQPLNYHLSDYHLYHGFNEEAVLKLCHISDMEIIKFTKYSSTMRLGLSCWVDSRLLKSDRQFSVIARKPT